MGLFDRFFGRKIARMRISTAKARGNVLNKDIISNDTLSDRTKQELNEMLKGAFSKNDLSVVGDIDRVRSIFNEAKEGVSKKFKSRQGTQQLFNAMVDRPDSQRLRGGILNFGSSVRK